MEEDQPRPGEFLNAEEIELLADFPMVGFFASSSFARYSSALSS